MADGCRRYRVVAWVYSLMPTHVHLTAAPLTSDGLQRAIGEAHRRYTLEINVPRGWRGHLLARTVFILRDGRPVYACSREIRRAQSGSGATGIASRRVPVEQRAGAPARPR